MTVLIIMCQGVNAIKKNVQWFGNCPAYPQENSSYRKRVFDSKTMGEPKGGVSRRDHSASQSGIKELQLVGVRIALDNLHKNRKISCSNLSRVSGVCLS